MTNREKYGERVLDTLCMGKGLALKDGKPVSCDDMPCEMCDWYDKECSSSEVALWLNAEYKEPEVDWSKVAVDTKIMVRDTNAHEWVRRYFSHFDNGTVYCFQFGATSWSNAKSLDATAWKYAKLAEDEE